MIVPKCSSDTLFDEGEIGSTQEKECIGEGIIGKTVGECIINEKVAMWNVTKSDCSIIFIVTCLGLSEPYNFQYNIKPSYALLIESIDIIPAITPKDKVYQYSTDTLPNGLSLDSVTGVISGYITNTLIREIVVSVKKDRELIFKSNIIITSNKSSKFNSSNLSTYRHI